MITGCGPAAERAADGASVDVDRLRELPYAAASPLESTAQDGVIVHSAEHHQPGALLVTVQKLCRADLLADDGTLLRSWSLPGGKTWEHVEPLTDGGLLVIGADDSTPDDRIGRPTILDDERYLARLDRAGALRWRRPLAVHHDLALTADGRVLALGFERRVDPRFHARIPVRDDRVWRLTADGAIEQAWSLLDAADRSPTVLPLQPVQKSRLGGPPWIDLFHTNAIAVIADGALTRAHPLIEPGQLLLCFRHQDRIAVLDLQRGEFVWSFGQDVLSGPHDAQVLDNGHLLVFDNGLVHGRSRGLEIDALSGRIVWQYQADPPQSFFTASKGSIERLANGNTLLAESDRGRVFEVTGAGALVWEYFSPHRIAGQRAAIVRAKRVAPPFAAR